jgi:hypothetical protein
MDWSIRGNRAFLIVLGLIVVVAMWVRINDSDRPPEEFLPLLAAMDECRVPRDSGDLDALVRQTECEDRACEAMPDLCSRLEMWREQRAVEAEYEREQRERDPGY